MVLFYCNFTNSDGKKNLHQPQDILKFNCTLQPSVLQAKVKRRAIETGSLCRIPVKPGDLMLDGLWGLFKTSSEMWVKNSQNYLV